MKMNFCANSENRCRLEWPLIRRTGQRDHGSEDEIVIQYAFFYLECIVTYKYIQRFRLGRGGERCRFRLLRRKDNIMKDLINFPTDQFSVGFPL